MDSYKRYKNKLISLICAAKIKYFKDYVIKHKKDSHKIWKVIN